MSTLTIGVDLAKSVFSVCAVDGAGHVQRGRISGVKRLRCGWRNLTNYSDVSTCFG